MPDGETVRSTLKPIGEPFSGATIEFNTSKIRSISLEPASEEEISDTVKVMGGDDWERWIAALSEAGVLADGCITTNYTYLGSEVTWPIYYHGTIGKAKEDVERAAEAITAKLSGLGGKAWVSVNKALVTQASSAIPVVPLYISLLYKVMKADGTHEDCIEQMDRLFRERHSNPQPDEAGRIRIDDWEMTDDVQEAVDEAWKEVETGNLEMYADLDGYESSFLRLFGFGLEGVDYGAETDPSIGVPSLVG